MLLGHGYLPAGRQACPAGRPVRQPGNPAHAGLNKDSQYKSYPKAQLKTSVGTEADEITGSEGWLMSRPIA